MNKLISVIIPVYNAEEYIEQCIDSVINQTYKNIEIILVDDGSKDNSPAICDRYAKEYDNVSVIHKENGGAAAARNMGVDSANGEYIGFLDSDDFLLPEMYEVMMALCEEYNGDMSVCKTIDIRNRKVPSVHKTGEVTVRNSKELYDEIYTSRPSFNTAPCNKLYKKEIFDNVRFPEGMIYEDEAIVPRLFEHTDKIVFIDRILYCYYLSPISVMRGGFAAKRFDQIKMYEDRIAYFKAKGMTKLEKQSGAYYYLALSSLYYEMMRSDWGEKEKWGKVIKDKIEGILSEDNIYITKTLRVQAERYLKHPGRIAAKRYIKRVIKKVLGMC